jgi:hypothetical protein
MHDSRYKRQFLYRATRDPKEIVMKSYCLTPAGKKFAATSTPTTHSGAVVAAVRKLKSATSAQIVAEVTKLKLETKMAVPKLVAFMIYDLSKRRGVLKSSEAKSA